VAGGFAVCDERGRNDTLPGSSGNVISETAWSYSGGGISAYEARPAYQNGGKPAPAGGAGCQL